MCLRADYFSTSVRRIDLSLNISTILGNNGYRVSPDGVPAGSARIYGSRAA